MRTALRILITIAAIVLLALVITPTLQARPQSSAADATLLNAANRDRAAGLPPLKWDNALAAAAHQHALRMAQANTLSHQLPGEPPMQERARHAGARFSLIAENVAQGPAVDKLGAIPFRLRRRLPSRGRGRVYPLSRRHPPLLVLLTRLFLRLAAFMPASLALIPPIRNSLLRFRRTPVD